MTGISNLPAGVLTGMIVAGNDLERIEKYMCTVFNAIIPQYAIAFFRSPS